MSFRDAITRELRASLLMMEPAPRPPADLDAEGEVLSAIIDGRVTREELAPLDSRHFYSDLNRAIWDAAKLVAPGDAVGLRAALDTAGWRGELNHELLTLWSAQPWVSVQRLRESVTVLIELWARRELIAEMRRLDRQICAGVVSANEGRARLERRLREVLA